MRRSNTAPPPERLASRRALLGAAGLALALPRLAAAAPTAAPPAPAAPPAAAPACHPATDWAAFARATYSPTAG